MNTGEIANWDGNMLDIGPIYPFVGWEGLMVPGSEGPPGSGADSSRRGCR